MCHFEFVLSIARGFAVPEQEQRQAAADAVAGRATTEPQRDAATSATTGKLRTHRPSPPQRNAS
jgi:hypothetical protein